MKSGALPTTRTILLIVLATWSGFLLVRATGPDDLLSRDQVKFAGYVLDIVENDAWLWQQDHHGQFASKPPLSQWLAAAATRAIGSWSRLSLTFPSWFATLITMLLVVGWTAREFGTAAAIWVPLLLMGHQLGLREVMLARSDPLYLCTTVLLALLTWRCWVDGAPAWPLVLAGSAAILTKGPLAWLLVLVALLITGRSGSSATMPSIPWRKVTGALLASLIIPALWLWWAQEASGSLAVKKLIGDELIGHLFGSREAHNQQSWSHHLLPLPWFLTRLAPTALIAIVAAVRLWKNPASDSREQLAEKFLLWWWLGGMVMLCLATHHRFIHLLAVVTPATMLAAREVSRWFLPERVGMYAAMATSSILPVAAAYLDVFDIQSPAIVRTAELDQFCGEVERELTPGSRLEFYRVHPATQVQLSRHQPFLQDDQVHEALSGEVETYIVVGDEKPFRKLAQDSGIDLFEVRVRMPLGREQLTLYRGEGRLRAPSQPTPAGRNDLFLTVLSLLSALTLYTAVIYSTRSVATSRTDRGSI